MQWKDIAAAVRIFSPMPEVEEAEDSGRSFSAILAAISHMLVAKKSEREQVFKHAAMAINVGQSSRGGQRLQIYRRPPKIFSNRPRF